MGLRLYYVESIAPFLDEILQNLIFPHFKFKLRDSFRILCPENTTVHDVETALLENSVSGDVLIGRSIISLEQFFRDVVEAHPVPRPIARSAALGKALRLALKSTGLFQPLEWSTQRQYLAEFRRFQHLRKIRQFSEGLVPPVPKVLGQWEKILKEKWGLWTGEEIQKEACSLLQDTKLEMLHGLEEIFFLGFTQVDGALTELVRSLQRGHRDLTLHLFIPPPDRSTDPQGWLAPLYEALEKISESTTTYQKLPLPLLQGSSYPTPLHEAHALTGILQGSTDSIAAFHGHGTSSFYLRELLQAGQVPTLNPSLVPANILQEDLREKDPAEEIYFRQFQEELVPAFIRSRLELARHGQRIPLRHLEGAYEILLEKARWESYQEELRPRSEWVQDLLEEFSELQLEDSSPWFPLENIRRYGQAGLRRVSQVRLFELQEGVFPKKDAFPLLPALAADPLAEHEAYLKLKAILHLARTSACFSFAEQDMEGRVQRPSPLWDFFLESPTLERNPSPLLHATGHHPYFSENFFRESQRLTHPRGTLDRGDLRSLKLRPLLESSFQDHPLSATYLDDYAKCPWKFFARRHLKLEEAEDWILEIEPKLKGRLHHSLLERVYQKLIQEFFSQGKIPSVEARESVLEQSLAPCLEEWKATAEFQRLPDRLRREEIDRLLYRVRRFLQMDADSLQQAQSDLFPSQLEWRFGKSPHPPVHFSLKDGTSIALAGAVDRIDHNPKTGEYLLLDYKTSGSEELARQLREGLSYQLFLYLFAVGRVLFPKGRALGALYGDLRKVAKNQGMARKGELKAFGLSKGKSKSFLDDPDFSLLQERLSAEFEGVLQNILSGDFSLNPKECQGERCPYHEICRYDHQPR